MIYGVYGNPVIAAAVGLVFPVSRVIYLQAYLSNPAKRERRFLPGWLVIAFLIGGGLVGVIGSVLYSVRLQRLFLQATVSDWWYDDRQTQGACPHCIVLKAPVSAN